MKVTAVFDIGKTNKKFFLFNEKLEIVAEEQQQFQEIQDEDGFPTEDLPTLCNWIKTKTNEMLSNDKFNLQALNFSTYGASFVHINKASQPITPLYNYLKPYPEEILRSFYKKYGPQLQFAKETASPPLGMLNSGLQLNWLKYTQPDIFKKIKWSLHLPQYLSYLFTGVPVSEYTSIGCHTGLWDYTKKDYHHWVSQEEIHKILAPIRSSSFATLKNVNGKSIKIGPGIHDSSASLLPYLQTEKDPFLLISTGTWSISLNPYSQELLSEEDLKKDCLNYLKPDGNPVKASRLFLGKEYEWQVKKLNDFYKKAADYHQKVFFDESIYHRQSKDREAKFHFAKISLPRQQPQETALTGFRNFETAYHRLLIELADLQAAQAERAIGKTGIRKIYVEGGFAGNSVFIQLLQKQFKNCEIQTADSVNGSALGAALMVSENR